MGQARPDLPVRQVGDLVLRRWLAQGGMAELYLATPADPARARAEGSDVVVVKRVLPQFSSSTNFVRMFAREARLAAMLQHPNIVQVHDAGGLGAEDCYFSMEYVHGVDLGELLDVVRGRGGALPLAHALTIAVSLCAGLHHAHEARGPDGEPLGIVHRDVSPSNVLLSYDGAVKLTDFGVAKAMAMTRLTEEGTRKGKLSYMSPEQASGETVDRRADVFAIGTVLFELLTMERLFGGENDLAVMYAILHRERTRPRDINPSIPAQLEQIVLRTVDHDLDKRPPTARALQRALERFSASVGLTLSTEALGEFIRKSVPVRPHPRDEPEFMQATTSLRTADQRSVTVAEDGAGTSAGPGQGALGTGPSGTTLGMPGPASVQSETVAVHPGASFPSTPVVGTIPPMGSAVPVALPAAGSMPHGAHAGYAPAGVPPGIPSTRMRPGSGSGRVTIPPASRSSGSSLLAWSIGLTVVAVFVVAGVLALVMSTETDAEDGTDERAAPAASPADQPASNPQIAAPPTTPSADPAAADPSAAGSVGAAAGTEASPDATAAVPEDAAEPGNATARRKSGSRRKSSRSSAGSTTPSPEPTPVPTPPPAPPPSKKPSPTDTLLPIVE